MSAGRKKKKMKKTPFQTVVGENPVVAPTVPKLQPRKDGDYHEVLAGYRRQRQTRSGAAGCLMSNGVVMVANDR